ncbi:SBBP repeat-containing protein [Flavobacterium sp.]|uniref:SBBP repeat-containing protein n=1 Tax=Flavobacterium sp. TaxID=239 RepID=UPI003751BC41
MNKNLLQKPTYFFTKTKLWSKTITMLLFLILLSVTKIQAQNLAWAKQIGGTLNDSSRSIAVDAAGNVYTTGGFVGTADFDPSPGIFNLTAAGSFDIFVTKLDATGNLVWAKKFGGASADNGYGISTDATGNVYTTGSFYGTVDFDPNAGVSNLASTGGSQDIFVTKLDTAGNLVWAKAMGGTSTEIVYGINTDSTGNIYTVGNFQGTADFDPNAGVSNLTSAGAQDIFITKLDTTGNLVWAKAMGGTGNENGQSISTDIAGNVYTTGYFQGTADFDPNAGVFNLTFAGVQDIFVTKLDATGNLVWAKAIGGTGNENGQSISTDTAGNVYTIGSFAGTVDFDPNVGVSNFTSAGSNDIFVTKLDAAGNLVWAKIMGGTSTDNGSGISTDAAGNVYITGYFMGIADFDPNAGVSNFTSTGDIDIFVSKLDAAGNLIWAKAMGGTNTDISHSISKDAAGNVYTTGTFLGTVDFDPNVGVSNFTSAGSQDIFVHKMSASGASLNFDGTDDFVAINSPTNIPIGNSSYTIEAKIKTTVFGSRGIAGWGNYGQTNQVNAFRLDASGQLVNYWWANDLIANPSPINLADGNWHHIVATYDGTTRKIFVDGILKASDTPGVNAIPNALNMRIGSTCPNPCGGEFYNGAIDEVRIWNRALPQAEIQNNMNCELAAGQTSLIAYYQFNQGVDNANNSTITTLTDSSGNNNTGTLNNFTLTGATSNWIANGGVTTGNTCSPFLSTSDFEYSSKLTVYPNPSSDIFTINSDTSGTIVVYDLIGKIIKTENLDLGITKLDLNNYSSGIYLMKVTNDNNQTKTVKLIKQ